MNSLRPSRKLLNLGLELGTPQNCSWCRKWEHSWRLLHFASPSVLFPTPTWLCTLFPLPGMPSPSRCLYPSIRTTQPSFSIPLKPSWTFHTQGRMAVCCPGECDCIYHIETEKLLMNFPFSPPSLDALPK